MRTAVVVAALLVACTAAGSESMQVATSTAAASSTGVGRTLLQDTSLGVCIPATNSDPAVKAATCTMLTGCTCDKGYKLLTSGGPVVAQRCYRCPTGQFPYSFPPNGRVMCVGSSQCPESWGFTRAYCWNPFDKYVGAFIKDQSNEQCNGFLDRFACTIPLCPYRCPPTLHTCCRSCISPTKACTLFCVAPTCGCSCSPQPIG